MENLTKPKRTGNYALGKIALILLFISHLHNFTIQNIKNQQKFENYLRCNVSYDTI